MPEEGPKKVCMYNNYIEREGRMEGREGKSREWIDREGGENGGEGIR